MAIPASQALVPFGFTELEARIYAFLLTESPATGYRIAQAIAKPAANVYKAIQTLEGKGAVLVEEEGARAVRPVSPEELLGRIERDHGAQRKAAAEAFAKLAQPAPDTDRVHTLRSAEQALIRARDALAAAQTEVLAAMGADPFELLHDDLLAADQRGVQVRVLVSAEIDSDDLNVMVGADEAELRLVVDGTSFLCVGEIGAGYWTTAPSLVSAGRRGLASEYALSVVRTRVNEDGGPRKIQRLLEGLR